MIFNMAGGEGASLNFAVVGGTTQPTAPKENTIWVNTSTKITGWKFSATQPAAAEGLVWFSTGAGSKTAFEALKKNGIMVYPISAQQYSGGAWANKGAKIYQGGEWADFWDGTLYYLGDLCYEATGGWTHNDFTIQGYSANPDCGINSSNELYCVGKPGAPGIMGIREPVNLSSYKTITLVGHTTNNEECSRLYISTTKELAYTSVASVALPMGEKSVTLDISGINGEYYVAIAASPNYSATSTASHIYLT